MDFEVNEILKDCGCVGLAQINPIAGNLEYNSNKIIDFIKQAESLNLDMVLFPKNALLGFNMPDFINRFPFILEEAQKWLEKIAIQAQKTSILLSYLGTDKKYHYAILRYGQIDKILDDQEYITSKHFHDGVEFYIKPIAEISRTGSQYTREEKLKKLAKNYNQPILEINQVGAIDGWLVILRTKLCLRRKRKHFCQSKRFRRTIINRKPF